MRQNIDTKLYYQTITSVDIITVARDLIPERITDESAGSLRCDCPHHSSKSHTSLAISSTRQAFYCFGCGVGGDVLQFVEWIATGKITKGMSGPMPESHRKARDYLANLVGLPPLSAYGMTPDQITRLETERNHNLEVQSVLTEVARFYHDKLVNNPEILEWFYSNYAITRETIDNLLIGYADNNGIVDTLTSPPLSIHPRTLSYTGAFRPTYNDTLSPFFKNRIVFPYWSSGRVVYLIGRKTLWTDNIPWESGKYKKLPVHDDHDRAYVSTGIKNDHLYNEDVLISSPESIIITEGVTDCIVLNQAGLPTISPVTVRLKKDDIERIVSKLRTIKTVYVCQDNEVSGVGLQGALDTAAILIEHNITTRLVILPRAESETKTDPNSWFLAGGTPEQFRELLNSAKTPLALGIDKLTPESLRSALELLLAEVAKRSPLEQEDYLNQIVDKTKYNKTTIKAQLKQEIEKITQEKKDRKKKSRSPRTDSTGQTSPNSSIPSHPDSCLAFITPAITADPGGDPPNYYRAAELAFEWFTAHGAQWFHTPDGKTFMFFANKTYWPDSHDSGRKRQWAALIYHHTGITASTPNGRIFFEVLANLSMNRGTSRKVDGFTWIQTKVLDHTVYLNLNNVNQEIVKISPAGVTIMTNAANPDEIILKSSDKFGPIIYDPDADITTAETFITDLIGSNLACSLVDRLLIISWLCVFPLIDFSETRPTTRFEGTSGSGKTTASKLISTLIFGSPQQKISTDAANYSDGAVSPLVVLDNVETKQMSDELIKFMLTTVTGITREKRKAGSDTGIVAEKTNCLLNTNGIEPLSGELAEIQTRSFIIQFDMNFCTNPNSSFLESDLLAQVSDRRSYILSAVFKKIALVLQLMKSGAKNRVMTLLNKTIPDNDKRRCNEYLALMYLYIIAGAPPEEIETHLQSLDPRFKGLVDSLNATSRIISSESNQIATCLGTLFRAYDRALSLDRTAHETPDSGDRPTHVIDFTEKYHVTFQNESTLNPVHAGELLAALRRIASDFRLEFNFRSPEQLSRRLINDRDILKTAGWEISREKTRTNNYAYSIRHTDTEDRDSERNLWEESSFEDDFDFSSLADD